MPGDGAILVSAARFLGDPEALSRRIGKTGVIWPNNRDLDDLVPYLDRLAVVALVFPTFRDGRAYSQARLLRERYGYRGELRATGQVLRDQFMFMLRAGFDTFETFGFPGHTVTGRELIATIESVTRSKFTLRPMSWWFLKTVGQLMALGRELSELEYLWRVPHSISGDKLKATLGGDIAYTPLPKAIAASLRAVGYRV